MTRERHLLSTLPVELKVTLGFTPDPTETWLQSDQFGYAEVGGIESGGEWLPTRSRALMDGTRFEIGARKVDLEGLLALARILKPEAKGLEHVVSFWTDHPKVKISQEDEFVFMGVDIPPTPEGLEQEIGAVNGAFELALQAAIEGKTYPQMLKDKRFSIFIRDLIERDRTGGGASIFGSRFEEWVESEEHDEESSCPVIPEVTVDTLREFPIDTSKTSVHFAPSTIVRDGVAKEFKDSWLIAHNGRNPSIFDGDETVNIFVHETFFNDAADKWETDGVSMYLDIPYGVEVKTVEDLKKLTRAFVKNRGGPENSLGGIVDVGVAVDDDVVRISTKDGSLSVEVRKPVCDECKTPVWKFRWPTDEEIEKDWDPYSKEFGMHGINTSLGIQRYLMYEDGIDLTHCIDCAHALDKKYLEAHPFASKARAITVARRRLDESGNQDIQIWEDQVWRIETAEGGKGWQFFTKIDYERDDRQITRFTGIPVLYDNGKFEPNLKPREYIDFRYKA